MSRFVLFLSGLFVFLLVSGCGPAEPKELRVVAKNFSEFNWWRSQAAQKFAPDKWREFNGALDEIRMRAMARGVSGTVAVGEELAKEINGRTIPEVLRLGDEAKLERLRLKRNKLKVIVDAQALVAAAPGDTERADWLAEKQTEHAAELQALVAEIAATKQQYAAHGGVLPAGDNDEAVTITLSRDEALQEFSRMLQRRSEFGQKYYGDWPVKFDRSGEQLRDEVKEEFLARKSAAAGTGRTVVAVYARAGWRIYDDTSRFPEFSRAVLANLTEQDRREIRDKWAMTDAEIWARKVASRERHDVTLGSMQKQLKPTMDGGPLTAPAAGLQVVEEDVALPPKVEAPKVELPKAK